MPSATPTDSAAATETVSPALLKRAARALGGEPALQDAARRGAVDEIARVQGIGPQRAAKLVQALRGEESSTGLCSTPRTQDLLQRIRDALVARARTKEARNHLALIAPLAAKERPARLAEVLAARDEIQGLDLDRARRALDRIAPLPAPPTAFEAGTIVFVDAKADRDALLEAGLDRWVDVASARDYDRIQSVDVAVYAYSEGGAAVENADHCIAIPFTTDPAALAPWSVTERYRKARAALEAAAELSRMRGRRSACGESLALLDALPKPAPAIDAGTLETEARVALERAVVDAEKALADITLTGADLVRALRSQAPAAVRELYVEAAARAQADIAARTGCDLALFTQGIPPELDMEAIAEAASTSSRKRALERHRALQQCAAMLVVLTPAVEAELEEHALFDERQSLGSFVTDLGLVAPEWGDGFLLQGALHLDFAPHGERVDYRLGLDGDAVPDAERIALLTGANSGGKTTLLETIAQVALLAHCGLPVPARRAVVPELDAIHFFAERRSLSAGAFETFLRRLFPVAQTEGRVLVLADELEAMTELEAAAEIIAAFLDLLGERDAFAVVVTHMAPHVAPSVHRPLRIDGIEARGLDSEGRLVVDRSPVIGRAARSTPELILRRLAAKGPAELRGLFGDLAERVAARIRDTEIVAPVQDGGVQNERKKRTRRVG